MGIGLITPEPLRLSFHRVRYRRKIAAASKAIGASGPFLPVESRIDFIVAGAQRAGTTALTDMLSQHPDIAMPVEKEPHFFDNDGFFGGRDIPIADFHRAFPFRGANKLYGEATPRIMFAERCLARVKRYNPDIKLICLIRAPVARAFSGWNMNYGKSEERGFREVIDLEMRLIEKHGPIQRGFLGYLSRGLYAH